MNNNSDSDDSAKSGASSPKKVKKWRKQKFNQDWLLMNEFKGWLKPVKADEYSCQCTA